MLDINDLIAALSGKSNVTINIYNNTDEVVEDAEPISDFTEGDAVYVCHTAKDGSGTRHVKGIVDTIDVDDFGPYVRVTGENGKHYKCGVKMNEERKGSKIFDFV